jgi:hypothetical protein
MIVLLIMFLNFRYFLVVFLRFNHVAFLTMIPDKYKSNASKKEFLCICYKILFIIGLLTIIVPT